MLTRFRVFATLAVLAAAAPVGAQQGAASAPAGPPATICGQQVAPPASLPPANSGPVLWLIAPCFEAQGGTSLVEPQTYLYYIQLKDKLSRPSENVWVPYSEETEKTIRGDFHRLWNTNFLDNLWIDVGDYTFSNGVVAKLVTYNMEERQRVKIVDFVGSKKVETSKIDERLKEANAVIRLDTFIDPGLVRKVEGIVREMLKEKGFQFASVTHEIKELAGGPKLVHVTFTLTDGPKVKIRRVEFVGNKAIGDGALKGQMKANKEPSPFLFFLGGRGTYEENKFADDADKVTAYYRDRGYITTRVGEPDLKFVGDPSAKKTRWVELHIPVTEGNRYKVGDFTFDGNSVVKTENLQPLFKLEPGAYYSEKDVRKGLEKAKEVYGAGGYFEFTGYPDLKPRDLPNPAEPEAPAALVAPKPAEARGPPIVDVTMRFQEGKQYFVNRITFVGNTTTRDNVIRREMRLVENGVFDTEALKYSVRRLNQLGYFKALEGGKDINVEKTPGADAKVDVRLKLEEQNRNQLTFGAGVSQFEGFFGQLSFQTSNFLGRGESLTVSVQAGSRAQNYTLAFTEPFLFDRNITGGVNLFRSEIRYIGMFTQKSAGGVLTFGFPLGNGFTRMFANYSYEQTSVTELSSLYQDPLVLARNPFLRDSLLIGQDGERTISKVVPTVVHNTVDQPIFPTTGRRYTMSIDLAGLGGNTNFYKPMLEGVWFLRQNSRMSLGLRGQLEYIRSSSSGASTACADSTSARWAPPIR
jgi:outer membrane protein insertion porin family